MTIIILQEYLRSILEFRRDSSKKYVITKKLKVIKQKLYKYFSDIACFARNDVFCRYKFEAELKNRDSFKILLVISL